MIDTYRLKRNIIKGIRPFWSGVRGARIPYEGFFEWNSLIHLRGIKKDIPRGAPQARMRLRLKGRCSAANSFDSSLGDLSFDVNDGEMVGYIGPNGAGKSSTIKVMTAYSRPTRASV